MATSTILYLMILAAALAVDHLVFWRRFIARSALQPQQARFALWWSWIGMLWVLSAAAIVLWVHGGKPWSLLRLGLPVGWRLWAGAALVLGVVALYAPTLLKLRTVSGERKAALRTRFGSHAALMPHTRGELALFCVLAITAGLCEELIFRGYLLWALQTVVGAWPAVALSCVIFALAHAYQGASGVVRTGLIGAFFMASVLVFDSLVPAMVAHALVDIAQGIVAWLILRENGEPDPAGTVDYKVVEGGVLEREA